MLLQSAQMHQVLLQSMMLRALPLAPQVGYSRGALMTPSGGPGGFCSTSICLSVALTQHFQLWFLGSIVKPPALPRQLRP